MTLTDQQRDRLRQLSLRELVVQRDEAVTYLNAVQERIEALELCMAALASENPWPDDVGKDLDEAGKRLGKVVKAMYPRLAEAQERHRVLRDLVAQRDAGTN